MANEQYNHPWYPADIVLDVLAGKWTIPILSSLHGGRKRPSELSKMLGGLNPKTLTYRLRELEKWGLISRQAFHEIPPRVEYELTERGAELIDILATLRNVGDRWLAAMQLGAMPLSPIGQESVETLVAADIEAPASAKFFTMAGQAVQINKPQVTLPGD